MLTLKKICTTPNRIFSFHIANIDIFLFVECDLFCNIRTGEGGGCNITLKFESSRSQKDRRTSLI